MSVLGTTSETTSLTVTTDCNLNGHLVTGGIITPATITTTPQNDYNPTGLDTTSVLRVSSTIVSSITGLAGGIDGRRMTLENVGIIPIVITSEDTLSTAANRFELGGINARLVSGAVLGIIYDGVINRWRVNSATAGAATPGGLVQSVWAEVTTDISTTTVTWPTNRSLVITAGTLPTGTIVVDENGTFPTSGTLRVLADSGEYQDVAYTGIGSDGPNDTFTGCTGGTGSYSVGSIVWGYPDRTTIAAGSDGASLPQATINVVDTTGFPTSGDILIETSNGNQQVSYTGTTATTFTGCTGGTGTMSTGGIVTNVSSTAQDLIRLELSTQGGALIIQSAASVNTKNNQIAYFHIILDGFVRRGGSTAGNGSAPGGSTVIGLKLDDVPAGDHVAVLRWRVDGGFSNLYPVTLAEFDNANMLIQEVSS